MKILHLISSEKCQVWHKSEVNSADLRIERDIINKFKEWKTCHMHWMHMKAAKNTFGIPTNG